MQKLEDALKFQQWKQKLEENKVQINAIHPLHLVHKPNGEMLFALINIDAQDDKGEKLLPVAMLRGHFVSVVTVLIAKETQEKFLLLVQQYRIANGEFSYEHPAGMFDSQTDPFEVARKEVQEETGLTVEKSDLHLLNNDLLFTSPGLLDEGGYFFYCELEMPLKDIEAFQGKTTGAENEREFIKTAVVPIDEAMQKMSSAMARLNLFMYKEANFK